MCKYLTPNTHTQFYHQQLAKPVFTIYLHYCVFFLFSILKIPRTRIFFRLQIRIFNFVQILNSTNQPSNKTVASSLHGTYLFAFSDVMN